MAAQCLLAEVPLDRFVSDPIIPPEVDEVTRLILDRHDAAAFSTVAGMTVGGFREWLLDYATDGEDIRIDVILLAPGRKPTHIENAWMPFG